MQLSQCSVLDDLLLSLRDIWTKCNTLTCSVRDNLPLDFRAFWTYMRLELLLGSARAYPGGTCISLCGWKGVILSLSLTRCLSALLTYPLLAQPCICKLAVRRQTQQLNRLECPLSHSYYPIVPFTTII